MVRGYVLSSILSFYVSAIGMEALAKDDRVKSESKNTTQEFMQSKRLHMHEVFDAVLSKDFEQIIEKSRILLMLSQASTWHQVDSEEYKNFTKEFQDAVKFTITKAEAKSGEGVAQGYSKTSQACMKCHYELRWKKK